MLNAVAEVRFRSQALQNRKGFTITFRIFRDSIIESFFKVLYDEVTEDTRYRFTLHDLFAPQ